MELPEGRERRILQESLETMENTFLNRGRHCDGGGFEERHYYGGDGGDEGEGEEGGEGGRGKKRSLLYMAGTSFPTLADISLMCEMEQLTLLSYDLSPYPRVRAWQMAMRSFHHVSFLKVHQSLYKFQRFVQEKRGKQQSKL